MRLPGTSRFVLLPHLLNIFCWFIPGTLLFFYAWWGYRRFFPPYVFPIQATAFVVLCSWAVWKLARREGLPRSPLTWPLLALLASTTLSTYFSVDPRRSFDGLLTTLVMVLGFFLVCDLLLAGWKAQTFVTMLLWLATLLMGVGLWTQAAYYWEQWQAHTTSYPPLLLEHRLFGVVDHPNFLAGSLNLVFPFAVLRLAWTRSATARAGWALWLGGFVLVLFWTRSRGGWVAASAAAAFLVAWLLVQRGGLPWRTGLHLWLRQTGPVWGTTLAYAGLFLLLLGGPDLLATFQGSLEDGRDTAGPTFTLSSGGSLQSASSSRRLFWSVAWDEFVAHPLTGSGPLTYARAFVRRVSSVRFWSPSYAHSLYVETLGSLGIPGVVALLWLILAGFVAFARSLWRTAPWHRHGHWSNHDRTAPLTTPGGQEDEHQAILVGVCAALTGFLVHSLVDIIGKMPANDLVVVVLAALGVGTAGALRQGPRGLPRWIGTVLIVPALLLVVLLRHGAGQQAMFDGVIAALRGDWPAAAHQMDRAVAADPAFAFSYGQRGYAYSVLAAPVGAEGSPEALARALESYAVSLQVEPDYVPNLLNAAALLEQAGMAQQAEHLLERALALPHAKYWALPALLLGNRYADQGRTDEANALFHRAFASEPYAPDMAACRRSLPCRHAAQPISPTLTLHEEVRMLLSQDKPTQALDLLNTYAPLSTSDPLAWFDRAEVHLALGQHQEARYALDTADALRSAHQTFATTEAHAALLRAEFWLAEGQPGLALAVLERAARPQLSLEGYGYGAFHRIGLPGLLHPRLDLLQRTADDLRVYTLLARLSEEQGKRDQAAWARTQAQALAPLLTPD
ncbi:MAG: hypothetical protein HC884_09795 [Chloroflexaceae bacterium]|nr:hypothetical protein [Chloroflexaceae bacterium]